MLDQFGRRMDEPVRVRVVGPRRRHEPLDVHAEPFVKDPERKVGDLLQEAAATLGGAVAVTSFERFKVGGASEA